MRVVRLQDGLAGKCLAMPIHSDGGRLLAARGLRLTHSLISLLMQRGYTRVAVEDPLLDDVELDTSIGEETRQRAVYAMDRAARNILSGAPDIGAVVSTVDDMVEELRAKSKTCIGLYSLNSYDEDTYTHSLNVSILAIVVGNYLGRNPDSLKALGLGALLHDIGKLLIPRHILNKPSRLSESEYGLVQTHAKKGWELLSKCYDVSQMAARAAFEHHERLDGTGYPRGMTGDISDTGRITAVADVYEAMTADRPHRKALMPEIARTHLLDNSGTLYDPQAVEGLVKTVALYPTGTILSLRGEYTAVVIKQDTRSNVCPFVRIVSGPDVTVPTDVALVDHPQLTVEAVLDDYPQNAQTPWPAAPVVFGDPLPHPRRYPNLSGPPPNT